MFPSGRTSCLETRPTSRLTAATGSRNKSQTRNYQTDLSDFPTKGHIAANEEMFSKRSPNTSLASHLSRNDPKA